MVQKYPNAPPPTTSIHLAAITSLIKKSSNWGSIMVLYISFKRPEFALWYFVYQLRARMQASIRRSKESIRLLISSVVIAAHADLMHLINSAVWISFFFMSSIWVYIFLIFNFKNLQICSIGFKSGECAGQLMNSIPCSINYCVVDSETCIFALSC